MICPAWCNGVSVSPVAAAAPRPGRAKLVAWQALNKLENRKDARFSDAFLIVSPGITIRDRLRVLLPTDPDNYYRQRDLLPPDMLERLAQARIVITNYHAFLLRERGEAAKLTKSILGKGDTSAFRETPDQMVRRVARELSGRRNIVVINDEAHHCYWRKTDAENETLTAEERAEAKRRDEDARVWSGGLEAVHRKLGIRNIYDLSATPFFLSDAKLAISTADVPTWTQAAPIVGQSSIHTLDDLRQKRLSEVAFLLAKLTIEKYFRRHVSHVVADTGSWEQKLAQTLESMPEVLRRAGSMKSIEVFYNFMIMDANMNVFMRDPDKVTAKQAARMDAVWGDNSWRSAAYGKEPGLFGEIEEKASNEVIAEAFRERLEKVAGFAYVLVPMPMRNSRGAVVYYLYFASQNKTGAKIVNDIFDKYRNKGAV